MGKTGPYFQLCTTCPSHHRLLTPLEQSTQPPDGVSLTFLEGAVVDLVLGYLAVTQLRRRRQPRHTDVTRSHARQGQLRGCTGNWVNNQEKSAKTRATPQHISASSLSWLEAIALSLPELLVIWCLSCRNQHTTVLWGCLGGEMLGCSTSRLTRACWPQPHCSHRPVSRANWAGWHTPTLSLCCTVEREGDTKPNGSQIQTAAWESSFP